MSRVFITFVLCGCISLPAVAAPTGTVTMKWLGHGAGAFSNVSLYASSDGTYDPIAKTGYEFMDTSVGAGYYVHDVSGATGDGVGVSDPLLGFCIDLVQPPAPTYAVFDVVPLTEAPNPTFISGTMTEDKANMLRELWGRHFSASMTNQQAAEFQLAVWEIVFETSGTYDISTGSLMSTNLNAGTNALLNSLDGTGPRTNLLALTNPLYQDMLISVPAPGAMLLGVLGTAVVGWLRSRKRL